KPPSENLRYVVRESPPAEPVMVAVPRPVGQERLALDLVALDEPPVAAVLGVVTVVTHDEVGIGRHGRRLAAVGVATLAILDRARAVGEFRVGLDARRSVHVHLTAAVLDTGAGRRDDPREHV